MINLTKAILHILDGNAGVTVFSAAQLDLADDAAYGYVSKHLEKAAGDPGLHSGEFIGVENEFKIKLSQYAREMLAFEPFSAWIAGQAWEILSNSNRIDSSDLLVAEYFEGEKKMLAVLKCTGKLGYTHMVEVDEEGRQVCRIVNQYDILPGTGQKLTRRLSSRWRRGRSTLRKSRAPSTGRTVPFSPRVSSNVPPASRRGRRWS